MKALENVSAVFRSDTWPAVCDLNNRLVRVSACSYRNCASLRRILDRIVDHVDDGLPKEDTVGINHDACVPFNCEVLALFFCKDLNQTRSLPPSVEESKTCAIQLYVPRFCSGDCEKAIDQSRQTASLFEHAANDVAIVPRFPSLWSPTFPTVALSASGVR